MDSTELDSQETHDPFSRLKSINCNFVKKKLKPQIPAFLHFTSFCLSQRAKNSLEQLDIKIPSVPDKAV